MARRPASRPASAGSPATADAAAQTARRLPLPDALDSRAAPALLDALRGARGAPLALDASSVRKLGGRCAQVLLSAAATWRADSQTLTLHEPSPELVESLRLLGLTPATLCAGASAS